jgi:single-stranded-DNA-specific exonuclease
MQGEERIWDMPPADEGAGERLASALAVPPLTGRLLVARGISSPQEARRYLSPSFDDFLDPFALTDMESAVSRLSEATEKKERITVVGHEDTDGITGSVVVLEGLREIGADCDYYLPSRIEEGHGLSLGAISHAAGVGASLIVTVDCGVSDRRPVAEARRRKIDVIVLDHHEVAGPLPEAAAVVDPKRPMSRYPFNGLAGVGVAYKFVEALLLRAERGDGRRRREVGSRLLELVLLGTIADRVPLRHENRVATVLGLAAFASSRRIGISALKSVQQARVERTLGSTELVQGSISLIASARSSKGKNIGCELLLSADAGAAEAMVAELSRESQHWQAAARAGFDQILAMIDREIDEPLIILVNEEIPYYLLGHCASRLRKLYQRPAIIIGVRGTGLVGEGRAPEGFDLVDCLAQSRDLLDGFGGHKGAAGFSLERDRLGAFTERVRAYAASRLDLCNIEERLQIDAEISTAELGQNVIEVLGAFRPYGEGNRAPHLLLRGVEAAHRGSHCHVDAEGKTVTLVDERKKADWTDLSGNRLRLDIVFTLGDGDELAVVDCRPSRFNR